MQSPSSARSFARLSFAAVIRALLLPFARLYGDQRGSQGVSTAGAALAAGLIIAALLAGSGVAGPRVEGAMQCAAGVLSGGGGCAGGSAPGTGTAPNIAERVIDWTQSLIGGGETTVADRSTNQPPNAELKPCPTLPNAGVADHRVPQNTIDLWNIIQGQYKGDNATQKGPIGITQIGENRYLVTLVGIESLGLPGSNYNNLNNAISEGLGGSSPYQRQVEATIRAQIPAGAEIVIAGHSEGGIVAQNLAADHDFNRSASSWWNNPIDEARRRLGWGQQGEYTITNVVTYGSPMSQVPVSGVDYTMVTTSGDPVSRLSVLGRGRGPAPDQIEIPTVYENGGFNWRNPFEAHSAYGPSLQAIQGDPNSPLRSVLELPFGIDRWSQTETYAANRDARRATEACGF